MDNHLASYQEYVAELRRDMRNYEVNAEYATEYSESGYFEQLAQAKQCRAELDALGEV